MYGFWAKTNRKSSVVVLIAAVNSPAVLIAESFGDGKAKAGTFFGFVGLIETIEDFFEILSFDLGAVIRNGHRSLGEINFQSLLTVFDSIIEQNIENLENILFG